MSDILTIDQAIGLWASLIFLMIVIHIFTILEVRETVEDLRSSEQKED